MSLKEPLQADVVNERHEYRSKVERNDSKVRREQAGDGSMGIDDGQIIAQKRFWKSNQRYVTQSESFVTTATSQFSNSRDSSNSMSGIQ
jgi:hypothetical protein